MSCPFAFAYWQCRRSRGVRPITATQLVRAGSMPCGQLSRVFSMP